jgi:hypothetical protein
MFRTKKAPDLFEARKIVDERLAEVDRVVEAFRARGDDGAARCILAFKSDMQAGLDLIDVTLTEFRMMGRLDEALRSPQAKRAARNLLRYLPQIDDALAEARRAFPELGREGA